MSSFYCEICGAPCTDSERGYITGCKHYPPDTEAKMKKTAKEILKKHLLPCNCNADDKWHIDEQDFDSVINDLAKLVLAEKKEHKFNSTREEFDRIAWNATIDHIAKLIKGER